MTMLLACLSALRSDADARNSCWSPAFLSFPQPQLEKGLHGLQQAGQTVVEKAKPTLEKVRTLLLVPLPAFPLICLR